LGDNESRPAYQAAYGGKAVLPQRPHRAEWDTKPGLQTPESGVRRSRLLVSDISPGTVAPSRSVAAPAARKRQPAAPDAGQV